MDSMKRRKFLGAVSSAAFLGGGLAGCLSSNSSSDGSDEKSSGRSNDSGNGGSGDDTSGNKDGSNDGKGDGGSNTDSNSNGDSQESGVVEISMSPKKYFDPIGVYIESGDTIKWVNKGGSHSATAYEDRIPQGAKAFDTGVISKGKSVEVTLETPGTYDYFCKPHKSLGMVGRIVVGEPGGPAEESEIPELPKAGTIPPSDAIVEHGSLAYPFATKDGKGDDGDGSSNGNADNDMSGMKGPKNGDDLPDDPKPKDGYPPKFDTVPEKREIDTSSFKRISVDGNDVPLAPIEATYYWYARGEARFADARGTGQYKNARIYGAVSNPVNTLGSNPDKPAEKWPKDDRIVCYCGCPHHLSSQLASQLMSKGYKNVYVIDEGFGEWYRRKYPMAGEKIGRTVAKMNSWTIRGKTDPKYSGETAWAYHDETEQIEATDIEKDGTYEMDIKFFDINRESKITVETPGYTVEAPLRKLVSRKVSASMR